MFGGYRRHVLAIGIVAAALVALITGAVLVLSAHHLEAAAEHQADNNASGYARRANIAVERRCRRLPPINQSQCVQEEREIARQGERAERELEAQAVTAVWTNTPI